MPSEKLIQINIINLCHQHPILSEDVCHIANGGKRSKREARTLKLMGVKKGVSDLFLSYPNATYHGMWQEVKTDTGHLTKEQENFLCRKRTQGYACEVVRCEKESLDIFLSYLNNEYKPIAILNYKL